ncbi:hypothetical protein F2P81_020882 [Scophthalmus maximus]|uniref:ribonuclease H n=1 Tax=Scophthalmus maximus TaxID=52904 RepID=A0A6A4S1K2_SCOMX|nr:hypothetical protein F2P81_020882 [Scophthalmus maximus]
MHEPRRQARTLHGLHGIRHLVCQFTLATTLACSVRRAASRLSTTSPSSTKRYVQSFSPLHLALRDDVTAELRKLFEAGIIEQVNASPWISNLVVPVYRPQLELHQGYLQVTLHPNSHDLTAFVSHVGVFCYTPMPFGLSSAPSCFKKIMSTMFAGIPGVVIYLDDIVVHGTTPTLPDERLTRVLDVLASHNLTLNGEKCIFAVSAVEFVGFA